MDCEIRMASDGWYDLYVNNEFKGSFKTPEEAANAYENLKVNKEEAEK